MEAQLIDEPDLEFGYRGLHPDLRFGIMEQARRTAEEIGNRVK